MRFLLKIAKFRNFWYSKNVKTDRRAHQIEPITVNGKKVIQVIIDAHYEKNHRAYMSDDLILALVRELDGRLEVPDEKSGRFSYFATLIEKSGKMYRLVWLLEDDAIYIGVVNAYRDRRRS